eukprot:5120138-Prymnesium_polylepis.1
MVRDVPPLQERLRDNAIVASTCGGTYRAIHAARHGAPIVPSALMTAATWGALSAGFIGLRHLILQERWHEDREAVTGMALGVVGGGYSALAMSPRIAGHMALGCFFGGCGLHYAHRWWLHYRLAWDMGWRVGDGW